jgi:aryl-alcohol dehydrogenase-like predicted oxidoreductase
MWFEFIPKESFEAEIDGSLSRIGIDYFDLVFCFTPPKELAPAELVGQLADLVATGKIRYWAPGNWPIEFLAECCAIAKRAGAPLPRAAMVPYSLSIRSFVENDAMGARCHDYDIGLARERGYTPAQLAYAYGLRHPQVASVLFGATSTAQVEENVSALEIVGRLDDELLARLDAIFPKGPLQP